MDLLQSMQWGPLLLAVLLAFSESALGVGAFFPGELAITALAATLDEPDRAVAIIALTLGATAGGHVGYVLGRHFGLRLPESRLIQRVGPEKWDAAARFIQRRGAPAVFLSRLLPIVRTVMPAVAGVAGLRYSRFAVASVSGSMVWATMWVSAGGVVSALGALTGPTGLALSAGLGAVALTLVSLQCRHARGDVD